MKKLHQVTTSKLFVGMLVLLLLLLLQTESLANYSMYSRKPDAWDSLTETARIGLLTVLLTVLFTAVLESLHRWLRKYDWTRLRVIGAFLGCCYAWIVVYWITAYHIGTDGRELWFAYGKYGIDNLTFPRAFFDILVLYVLLPAVFLLGAKTFSQTRGDKLGFVYFLGFVLLVLVAIVSVLVWDVKGESVRLLFHACAMGIAYLLSSYHYFVKEGQVLKKHYFLINGAVFAGTLLLIFRFLEEHTRLLSERLTGFFTRSEGFALLYQKLRMIFHEAGLIEGAPGEWNIPYHPMWNMLYWIGKLPVAGYVMAVLLFLVLLWEMYRRVQNPERRIFAGIGVTMLTLRWLVSLGMGLTLLPFEETYPVQPFGGNLLYDTFLIAMVLSAVTREKKGGEEDGRDYMDQNETGEQEEVEQEEAYISPEHGIGSEPSADNPYTGPAA